MIYINRWQNRAAKISATFWDSPLKTENQFFGPRGPLLLYFSQWTRSFVSSFLCANFLSSLTSGISVNSRSRPFPRMKAPDSKIPRIFLRGVGKAKTWHISQFVLNYCVEYIPNFGKEILSFPSHSWISGLFFYPFPIFGTSLFIPFRFTNFGNEGEKHSNIISFILWFILSFQYAGWNGIISVNCVLM